MSMSFGVALDALRNGARVQRAGWNGKGMWLRLVGPMDGWQGRLPAYPCDAFIELKTAGDTLVPWVASQTDLLATDWVVVEAP